MEWALLNNIKGVKKMTQCDEALQLQREIARLLRDNQRLLQALCSALGNNLDSLGLENKL